MEKEQEETESSFVETEKAEADESGFSEKQSDLDAEIRAGEWQNLRRFRAYRLRSRQGKILATYQAVSNRLNQLVKAYYQLVSKNPKQGEKMLEELQRLRLIQELLLNMLVWKPTGQIDKDMIPKEILDLIE